MPGSTVISSGWASQTGRVPDPQKGRIKSFCFFLLPTSLSNPPILIHFESNLATLLMINNIFHLATLIKFILYKVWLCIIMHISYTIWTAVNYIWLQVSFIIKTFINTLHIPLFLSIVGYDASCWTVGIFPQGKHKNISIKRKTKIGILWVNHKDLFVAKKRAHKTSVS